MPTHILSSKDQWYSGIVTIWFRAHYADDPRDWNNIREFEGNYHPLLGYYQSDDPDILKQQLHWIRRAGVDLIVYDAFPTGKRSLTDLSKDKTLQLLLHELNNQTNEIRKLKLCLWLEKYLSNPTVEEYNYALEYIRQNISNYNFYFRYKGRPLLLVYLNGENRAIDEIELHNYYFEIRRVRPFYSDVWSYIEDYPQRLQKECISACPGFDAYLENAYIAKYVHKEEALNLEEVYKNAPRAERKDGTYYERQLYWAKQANPDIIFISGWNDWQYSNQIEPAVEYEFKYVDLTAKCLGRWEETAPYR